MHLHQANKVPMPEIVGSIQLCPKGGTQKLNDKSYSWTLLFIDILGSHHACRLIQLIQ